jgi:hypothetical protein
MASLPRFALLSAILATPRWAPSALAAGLASVKAAGSTENCELIIAGRSVERLILVNDRGRYRRFANPTQRVSLRAGKYRVAEVLLRGGYLSCPYGRRVFLHEIYRLDEEKKGWFTVGPDQPYRLQVGAPLSPRVTVQRRGRNLIFDYDLADGGGNSYYNYARQRKPTFLVRKGGRVIASGSFEYG